MSKKYKTSEDDAKLFAKLDKIFPGKENKLAMIGTLLGMGATLTEFLHNNTDIRKLPVNVIYACINLSGNMLSLTSGNTDIEYQQPVYDSDYEFNEHWEEYMRRNSIEIIKTLHEMYVKNGDIDL